MYPTLKDIETGEIKICNEYDYSVYWWTEGNGGCDCNRANVFNKRDELDKIMREGNPELKENQSYCYGWNRFIAIDAHGNLENYSKQEIIDEMNSGYEIND